MSIERELARKRNQANAEAINRRHRRAREQAARLAASRSPVAPINGVSPGFAAQIDAARRRAKAASEGRLPESPQDAIERLRREGKLPPADPAAGVGYEPTAEEVLGELAASDLPAESTETLPSADEVLSGAESAAPENASGWGAAPAAADAPARPDPVSAPAMALYPQPDLARSGRTGHSNGKRRR